jgi:hypothetical protein
VIILLANKVDVVLRSQCVLVKEQPAASALL